MQLEIGSMCSNCKGIDKCNKMCILHCGKALTDFISRVDVIPTKIGEYERSNRDGAIDLVVSGHILYNIEESGWLLSSIETTLDASDKFLNCYNKNAFQIASVYCKHAKKSPEETQEITDKIRGINKNKLFVLPFKPRTSCTVDFETDTESLKKQDAQINSIKWNTDKDTHKINCILTLGLNNKVDGISKVTVDIKDYINKFRLSQMEIQAKGKNHNKDIIKINDYGIFKPIYVSDGGTAVAIDGTYMYYIINDETHIIGYWDEKDNMKVVSNIKTKAFNIIMNNIEYIKHHKRYIAPYLLLEPNVINA